MEHIDTVRANFIDWLSNPETLSGRNEEALLNIIGPKNVNTILLMIEEAFTQGYMSCLQQPSAAVTISAEEKEALSGWVDLEETR